MARRNLPSFSALRAFEAVGRLGSVRKAATDLSINASAVSRHMRALEGWLGANLFEPGAPARLTAAGQQFHTEIAHAIDNIAAAADRLMDDAGRRRLSIWANGGFSAKWLGRELLTFSESRPDIAIELRPGDASPDLRSGEADIDIRFYDDAGDRPTSDGGLRFEPLARPPIFVVAAPGYAARHAVDSVRGLLAMPLLHEENDAQWRSWLGHSLSDVPQRLPGPRLWHAHIALDAAARGEGFALASGPLAAEDLAAGRLEVWRVDGKVLAANLGSYLFVARADRWTRPDIADLRTWLSARLAVDLKSTHWAN